jgi:glycosyltransferase involved in cell wall biosynthesis
MSAQPTATVIIPSYNSAATIGHTLTHLLKQTAADRLLQIIVVDSSDDGRTKEELQKFEGEKVRVITSGIRVMPAIQRNIGAAEATGDVLCFIDSDAYPIPTWLEQILQAYSEGVRVGGGSYLVPDFQRGNAIAVAQYYLEFNEYIKRGTRRSLKMVPTCNLFCERALFEQVGGIPEIRAAEDTMFGIKVSKESPITFLPEASVYHIFREHADHYFKNQALLGTYIYVYRKQLYDNRYLNPLLVSTVLPAFLLVKLARIAPRIALAGPEHWGPFFRSSPQFFQGLWHWGQGFRRGSRDFESLRTDFGQAKP